MSIEDDLDQIESDLLRIESYEGSLLIVIQALRDLIEIMRYWVDEYGQNDQGV